MIGKTLNYISHHAIAILALVCSLLALAGASYAATQLPKNSVGNSQIKNGAVTPPKFSKQIGGYVRLYAKVTPAGKIIYASPESQGDPVGAQQHRRSLARSAGARQAARSARPAHRGRTADGLHGDAIRNVRAHAGTYVRCPVELTLFAGDSRGDLLRPAGCGACERPRFSMRMLVAIISFGVTALALSLVCATASADYTVTSCGQYSNESVLAELPAGTTFSFTGSACPATSFEAAW